MTTPYIDPNLIFASNAPVKDKPAAFANYDKGWDESRKNEGRPSIKQMNYLSQQGDLKNLYIHENGAALPYKEGIAYEENAHVVKDGELVKLVDGEWIKTSGARTDAQLMTWSGRTQEEVNKQTYYIEDFGGGVDLASNNAAYRKAMDSIPNGGVLLLKDGGVYKFDNIQDAEFDRKLTIKSNGRATVIQSGVRDHAFKFDGSLAHTTTLVGAKPINTRFWKVGDTQGVKVGMLMVVMSDKSWYFDPRPESTDARKSEVHRVLWVDSKSSTVLTELESNDGYSSSENVSVRFYNTTEIVIENIDFVGTALNNSCRGVSITHGYNSLVNRCSINGYNLQPAQLDECYRSDVRGCDLKGACNLSRYALKILGSTLCFSIMNTYSANYAALDISAYNIVSLMCGAIGDVVQGGGGYNSDGVVLGYDATATLGMGTRGHGSHAGTDRCVYVNNKFYDCSNVCIVPRGLNMLIQGNEFYGRTECCIKLYTGGGAKIANNIVNTSTYSSKYTNLNAVQRAKLYPEEFVRFLTGWDFDRDNPTVISGNVVSVFSALVSFSGDAGASIKGLHVLGNSVRFVPIDGYTPTLFLRRQASTVDVAFERGFAMSGNTVTSASGYNLATDCSFKYGGLFIDHADSTLDMVCEAVDTSTVTGTSLSSHIVSFNGDCINVAFAVSGGTTSVEVGKDFAIDVKVPIIPSGLSGNSRVIGAASALGTTVLVAYQPTTGVMRLLCRGISSNSTSIRGTATYSI